MVTSRDRAQLAEITRTCEGCFTLENGGSVAGFQGLGVVSVCIEGLRNWEFKVFKSTRARFSGFLVLQVANPCKSSQQKGLVGQ